MVKFSENEIRKILEEGATERLTELVSAVADRMDELSERMARVEERVAYGERIARLEERVDEIERQFRSDGR